MSDPQFETLVKAIEHDGTCLDTVKKLFNELAPYLENQRYIQLLMHSIRHPSVRIYDNYELCHSKTLFLLEHVTSDVGHYLLRETDTSVLMTAMKNSISKSIVSKILDYTNQYNIQDHNGSTCLMVAIINHNLGYLDIAEKLINNGADLDIQNHTGLTALMFTIMHKQYDIAEKLINNGANVKIMNSEKRSAIMIALGQSKPNVHIIKLLIDKLSISELRREFFNVDNTVRVYGQLLYHVLKKGFPKSVELSIVSGIISKCNDSNTHVDKFGNSDLLMVTRCGKIDIIRYIIDVCNVNINHTNMSHRNALIIAILNITDELKLFNIVKLLVSYDIDINCIDHLGKTPLDYAILNNNDELCCYLVRHGAKYKYYKVKRLSRKPAKFFELVTGLEKDKGNLQILQSENRLMQSKVDKYKGKVDNLSDLLVQKDLDLVHKESQYRQIIVGLYSDIGKYKQKIDDLYCEISRYSNEHKTLYADMGTLKSKLDHASKCEVELEKLQQVMANLKLCLQ